MKINNDTSLILQLFTPLAANLLITLGGVGFFNLISFPPFHE